MLGAALPLALIFSFLAHIEPSCATTAEPFHTVYYHRLQGSFWAQLADDEGPGPTPRQLAIASIKNNFQAIRELGFDTVTIGLSDSDSWASQYGGGFSYDPKNPDAARPQFAVAQEIVLRLADKCGLKVIFSIGFSDYRRSSDGRPEYAGMADEYDSTSRPPGAYDYIHALIDPTVFYGRLKTTKLSTVGIADGPVCSHIGDARVKGWNLAGEWNVNVVSPSSKVHVHDHIFCKYWNYFFDLVHFNGTNSAFAATYLIGQPASGAAQVNNIKSFKHWFMPGSGVHAPDLIGVEFYAFDGYDLSYTYTDLATVVDAMSLADPAHHKGDFSIPYSHIYLGEGNTTQTDQQGVARYFHDVLQVMNRKGLAGVEFWVSDTLAEKLDASGALTLTPVTPNYDLFKTSFKKFGVRTYADLPPGIFWHGAPNPHTSYGDPTNYRVFKGVKPAPFGEWSYTEPTSKGLLLRQALKDSMQGRGIPGAF